MNNHNNFEKIKKAPKRKIAAAGVALALVGGGYVAEHGNGEKSPSKPSTERVVDGAKKHQTKTETVNPATELSYYEEPAVPELTIAERKKLVDRRFEAKRALESSALEGARGALGALDNVVKNYSADRHYSRTKNSINYNGDTEDFDSFTLTASYDKTKQTISVYSSVWEETAPRDSEGMTTEANVNVFAATFKVNSANPIRSLDRKLEVADYRAALSNPDGVTLLETFASNLVNGEEGSGIQDYEAFNIYKGDDETGALYEMDLEDQGVWDRTRRDISRYDALQTASIGALEYRTSFSP